MDATKHGGVSERPGPAFDPGPIPLRLGDGAPFEPHRFTSDEVLALQAAGVIDPDSSFELLDGELIAMPEEGELHLTFKADVSRYLFETLRHPLRILVDASLHLAGITALEPDFYVLEPGAGLRPVDPARVPLLIEIAVTSLDYDLGRKLAKYAAVGLPEYWVIDTGASKTLVFRRPRDGSYQEQREVRFDAVLTAERLPTIALRITDLPHIG